VKFWQKVQECQIIFFIYKLFFLIKKIISPCVLKTSIYNDRIQKENDYNILDKYVIFNLVDVVKFENLCGPHFKEFWHSLYVTIWILENCFFIFFNSWTHEFFFSLVDLDAFFFIFITNLLLEKRIHHNFSNINLSPLT